MNFNVGDYVRFKDNVYDISYDGKKVILHDKNKIFIIKDISQKEFIKISCDNFTYWNEKLFERIA